MGDRANIVLVFENDEELYLYTHWAGTEWPEELRKALEFAEPRWRDESYCARIITSRVFRDLIDSETGGGISPYVTDGGDRCVFVYFAAQAVLLNNKRYSFPEYVALTSPVRW